MAINEVIQKRYSWMSLQWFEKIKDEFYRHPYYVKEKGIISSTILLGMGDEREEMTINMTFEYYFWDNSINQDWFNLEDIYGTFDPNEDYFLFRPTAKQITQPILDALENTVSKLNSLQEKNIIIKSAITNLHEEKIKSQIVDKTEYNLILDYITNKVIELINSKYADIFALAGEVASYPDKIKLEINQNELAILVLLLCRSGIIDISKQPEKFSIDIISKNFLYKIEGTEEYDIPKNLNKQVSFFKPTYSPWKAPFDSLKNKIEFGFSDFK